MKTAVSAGGIVIKNNSNDLRICLIKLTPPLEGYVFPKGHIEPNESREDTAIREVKEETGLVNINVKEYLGVVTRKSTERDGTVVLKDIHFYLMTTFDTQQDTPNEEYEWFSFEETLNKLAFQEEKDFLLSHKEAVTSNRSSN